MVVGSSEKRSVILYLARKGADVNARDKYGLTPLHYSAMRGNDDAALDLLQITETKIEVISQYSTMRIEKKIVKIKQHKIKFL